MDLGVGSARRRFSGSSVSGPSPSSRPQTIWRPRFWRPFAGGLLARVTDDVRALRNAVRLSFEQLVLHKSERGPD